MIYKVLALTGLTAHGEQGHKQVHRFVSMTVMPSVKEIKREHDRNKLVGGRWGGLGRNNSNRMVREDLSPKLHLSFDFMFLLI